jgi:ABC-2 type transport system ATP-binding protein
VPRAIFLNGPAAGLYPRSGLRGGGTTIPLATQYLDEADHLDHEIAVLDHGRIIAEGNTRRLEKPHPWRPRPALFPPHRGN